MSASVDPVDEQKNLSSSPAADYKTFKSAENSDYTFSHSESQRTMSTLSGTSSRSGRSGAKNYGSTYTPEKSSPHAQDHEAPGSPTRFLKSEQNYSKFDSTRTIEIGDKTFDLGQSRRIDEELRQLKTIVDQERGHFQPVKQAICCCMLACVILMNLLMPSESSASVIGIESCSANQFYLQALFLVICITVTMIAVRVNQSE